MKQRRAYPVKDRAFDRITHNDRDQNAAPVHRYPWRLFLATAVLGGMAIVALTLAAIGWLMGS